jgi:AcrR family transcriptional regulator
VSGGDPQHADGRTVRLDREMIVEAAQRILREDGQSNLTMRRIGRELGVDPTAVYRHFRDKAELVTELADRAFSSIPAPDPQRPWQERIRQQLHGALELYRSNPDFAVHLANQADDTPGLMRVAERMLGALADAGLGPRDRAIVYQVFVNYAVGSGLFISQLERDEWGPDAIPAARRAYGALPADEYPHCVESAPYLFPGMDHVYDLGVDMFMRAIERLAEDPTTKEEKT